MEGGREGGKEEKRERGLGSQSVMQSMYTGVTWTHGQTKMH